MLVMVHNNAEMMDCRQENQNRGGEIKSTQDWAGLPDQQSNVGPVVDGSTSAFGRTQKPHRQPTGGQRHSDASGRIFLQREQGRNRGSIVEQNFN